MHEETAVLEDLGLTKNEAKVYVSLVGETKLSIARIATKSGVNRVNVYDCIAGLKTKGLVYEIRSGSKRFFAITEPERLRSLIRTREEQLNSILPQLVRKATKTQNQAMTSEGLDAIKATIEDMLVVKKPIVAFGIPKLLPDLLSGYLATFHRRRIASKISIRHIYNENARERIRFLNNLELSSAKFLPPEFNVPATTLIYGNKVAFWIWSEVPFCVLVESEVMADAYRKYFELLWTIAK